MGIASDLLGNLTTEGLLQVAAGLRIEKHTFTKAWHHHFHDSMGFIKATFDVFDTNGDGFLDGMEIEGIIDTALAVGGQWLDDC